MCRPKSQGGRRCPSHSDPIKRAARNARRREAYKLSTKVDFQQTIKNDENLTHTHSKVELKRDFLNRSVTVDDTTESMADAFKAKNIWLDSKELNIASAENEGEFVDFNYFLSKRIAGTINYNKLTVDSYKEFGFKDVDPSKDNSYFSNRELAIELEELKTISDIELTELNENEKASVKFFTSYSFKWFNNALYSKGKSLEEENNYFKTKDPFEKDDYGELNIYDNNTVAKNKDNVEKISSFIDSALAKAPKIQRVVYRGVSASNPAFTKYGGNVKAWIQDNAKLGQELQFDGYQSSTLDVSTANDFTRSESGGLIYEIITPEGLNVTSISRFAHEQEVLLPRESRYMVVGVHEDIRRASIGGTVTHVVQLVAIDDKGAILTGEKDELVNSNAMSEGEVK